jgi:hypothetical protein
LTLDALGNIGDFIGGIGVVVTLIYLAGQIRQNTRASQAETYQGLSSQFASTINSLASSSDSVRIYNSGLRDYNQFSEEEKTQFSFSMHAAFIAFENAFYLHQYGNLDAELWEKWRTQIEWYAQREGVVAWWKLSERFFSATFREHVNELISSR